MNKVVILVPCNGGIIWDVDTKLRKLETEKGYEVWRTPGYSAIDQCRNRMAYDAIYRRDFDELIWIDGDVDFELDDIEKLRNSNKDIIAGVYPFKGHPEMTFDPLYDNQEIIFGDKGSVYQVHCVATGFLYTKRKVYETMVENLQLPLCNTSFDCPAYPWFRPNIWVENGNNYYLGEDFSFCKYAQQSGFNIFIDSTIKLKHIGRYAYTWEDLVYKKKNISNITYCKRSIS
jgi:hypothetical protein